MKVRVERFISIGRSAAPGLGAAHFAAGHAGRELSTPGCKFYTIELYFLHIGVDFSCREALREFSILNPEGSNEVKRNP